MQNFDAAELYSRRDKYYWQEINKLIDDYNLSTQDILHHYMAFIQRRDLPQLLAYYELFKLIKDLPGSIAECGVFIGNGLFTWSKLMETFLPGVRGKKVYGFDNFSGYQNQSSPIDQKAIEYIQSLVGEFKVDRELINKLIELNNLDNLLMGVERVKLYDGDLTQSIANFKTNEIGVRLSLLLCDVNLYLPTKAALCGLYDLIVPGGIIALRGYGVKPWEGESKAVDEFLTEKGITQVHSFDFSMYPSIYVIKG